ncbi:MAK10-like protein, partial [Tanacetum coccineum]
MERFEEAILKQREEINGRMAEIFGLLRELTSSRTAEKVLIREEARHPVTKHVNSISLIQIKEEKSIEKQRGKIEREAYDSLPTWPIHNAILKKMITKKEDMGGNFVIPCNIGGLIYMDALVDQGSDVNIMPLSLYNRLTDEELVGTDIRLSLASHSYIYLLGIDEDVLVEIADFIYTIDFVILDIKEDKRRPFIIGTLFLATTRAGIRFDKGVITLRSGKNR